MMRSSIVRKLLFAGAAAAVAVPVSAAIGIAPAGAGSAYVSTSCHCALGQMNYILPYYVSSSGGNYGVYDVSSPGGSDIYAGFEYASGAWHQTYAYGLNNGGGTDFALGDVDYPPYAGQYVDAGSWLYDDSLNPWFW